MGTNVLFRLILWIAAAACLLTLAFIVAPLAIVILTGFLSAPIGGGGRLTLANYAYILTDPRSLPLLGTTIVFAIGSTALAVGLAAFFAGVIAFVDIPLKPLFRLVPLTVLIPPSLLKDPAWIILYSPKIGLVNTALAGLLGLQAPIFNIYTLTGMIISVGINVMPLAYLILLAPFESLDQSFEEASRMSGARPLQTIRRVVLPVLVPASLSAVALTMIVVASSFETPILIGLPGGVVTYMSAIYSSFTQAVNSNLNRGAAQSTVYLLMTSGLLAWYVLATRRERRFVSISSKSRTRRGRSSQAVRAACIAAFAAYFVVAFLLPILVTVLVSLLPYYSASGGNPLRPGLSLVHYRELLTAPRVVSAFVNSLWVSAVTVACTLVAAAGLSYIASRTRWWGRRLVEVIGTFPIGVPAIVFGLALLITLISIPGARSMYNSYFPMILAEVVVFLPFALRVISASMIQVDGSLLEAGQMSGAGRGRIIAGILIPLLAPATLNAAALVFIMSFRELGAVVLLVASNTPLVPTVTFAYWIEADFGRVAALNLVALVVPAAALAIAYLAVRGAVWLVRQMRGVTVPLPGRTPA